MISKLEIGKYYQIRGVGPWIDLIQDIQVISVTKMSQVEGLEIPIYDDWFAAYNISESKFKDLLKHDNYVYQCKKLISRDPTLVAEDGEMMYLFPDMIDYAESDLLLACKSYSWEVHTKPYTPIDPLNPMVLNIDMKEAVNAALEGKMFDTITTYRNEQDILVPEEEYNKIGDTRLYKKNKYQAEKTGYQNTNANRETFLFNSMATLDEKREELRLLTIQTNQYMQSAVQKFNANQAKEFQLNAKDTRLHLIYDTLVSINSQLPSGQQVVIPEYDDIA